MGTLGYCDSMHAMAPQANAVSDKVLDLRMCDFSGKDLSGKTLSGALLENAKLPNSNLREAIFSKARSMHALHL